MFDYEEINSSTWIKIKELAEQRLTKYRKQNDNNLGEIETAKLRGRITELKYLLSLQDEEHRA